MFVVTLVMGDFITVRLMGGGQRASVGLMISNQIGLLQYPAACANAVVLLAVVLLLVGAILRIGRHAAGSCERWRGCCWRCCSRPSCCSSTARS